MPVTGMTVLELDLGFHSNIVTQFIQAGGPGSHFTAFRIASPLFLY